jgi:hypothetical protein
MQPSLSVTGVWLAVTRRHHMGLPVFRPSDRLAGWDSHPLEIADFHGILVFSDSGENSRQSPGWFGEAKLCGCPPSTASLALPVCISVRLAFANPALRQSDPF